MSDELLICLYCGKVAGRCLCTRPAFVRERDPYAEAAALSGRDSLDLARELHRLDTRATRPLRVVR